MAHDPNDPDDPRNDPRVSLAEGGNAWIGPPDLMAKLAVIIEREHQEALAKAKASQPPPEEDDDTADDLDQYDNL